MIAIHILGEIKIPKAKSWKLSIELKVSKLKVGEIKIV